LSLCLRVTAEPILTRTSSLLPSGQPGLSPLQSALTTRAVLLSMRVHQRAISGDMPEPPFLLTIGRPWGCESPRLRCPGRSIGATSVQPIVILHDPSAVSGCAIQGWSDFGPASIRPQPVPMPALRLPSMSPERLFPKTCGDIAGRMVPPTQPTIEYEGARLGKGSWRRNITSCDLVNAGLDPYCLESMTKQVPSKVK
jgi:hypothetical protein